MGLITRDHRPAAAVVAAAALLSAAAVVLWIISLLGTWAVGVSRSDGWAWAGSCSMGAILLSRLRSPRAWRIIVGGVGVLGCAATATVVWNWAPRQTFPAGGSATGFVAMVTAAVAGGAYLATDGISAGRHRRAAAAIATAGLVLAAAGVSTFGWERRPVQHRTVSSAPLATGTTPTAPAALLWRGTSSPNASTASDGSQLYVAISGSREGVEAVDPVTGRVRWQWTVPGSASVGPAITAGGGAVAADFGTRTVVLDARTGTESWATPDPSITDPTGTTSEPVLGSGEIVWTGQAPVPAPAEGPDRVVAYALTDGRKLWQRDFSSAADCAGDPPRATYLDRHAGGFDSSVIDGDTTAVSVACPDAPMRLLVVSGSSSRPDRLVTLPSSPYVDGGQLMTVGPILVAGASSSPDAASFLGNTELWGVDLASARLLWHDHVVGHPDQPGPPTPTPYLGSTLLGATTQGVVAQVDANQIGVVAASDGHTVMKLPPGTFAGAVAVAVAGDHAYLASSATGSRGQGPYVLRSVDLTTGAESSGPQLPSDQPNPDTTMHFELYALPGAIVDSLPFNSESSGGTGVTLAAYG